MEASAVLGNQSNGKSVFLGKANEEFQSLSDKVNQLESEKAVLKEQLKSSEAKRNELTPQLLAKFNQESKDVLKLRSDLKSKMDSMVPALEEAFKKYSQLKMEADSVKDKFEHIERDSASHAALLFAKMDLYVQQEKDKMDAVLEQTKKEKSKAETDRQAANDLLKRANEQMQKIQDNGKAVLEKIAKSEKSHEDKLKVLASQIEASEKEKSNLEKELSRLADIHEKRKKLESGIK